MANALLLGGGAPTLTLEAGALAALHDNEVRFDVVSTAGAGMLVGLLFVAPKGTSARQALENTREMGVHDSIYDLFPVNFKVFHKPGGLADGYRRWLQSLPRLVPGQDLGSRLLADWMALWFAALCPSDISSRSLGLCDHAPWRDQEADHRAVCQGCRRDQVGRDREGAAGGQARHGPQGERPDGPQAHAGAVGQACELAADARCEGPADRQARSGDQHRLRASGPESRGADQRRLSRCVPIRPPVAGGSDGRPRRACRGVGVARPASDRRMRRRIPESAPPSWAGASCG
jgi:hypothetical protein